LVSVAELIYHIIKFYLHASYQLSTTSELERYDAQVVDRTNAGSQ